MLFDEHEVILTAIERLEKLLSAADLSAHKEALTDFVNFFQQYGDGYHHQKEEAVLFTLLLEKEPGFCSGIIDELSEHHQIFRERLQKVQGYIFNANWSETRTAFKEYLTMLKDHIGAENEELFVTADQWLNEREKESLYFSFLDKDSQLGSDRKKDYESKMLNRE